MYEDMLIEAQEEYVRIAYNNQVPTRNVVPDVL
jgi:hypothetical protein